MEVRLFPRRIRPPSRVSFTSDQPSLTQSFYDCPTSAARSQGYYWVQFGLIAIACASLEMQKMGIKERVSMPQNFIAFRNGYLFVYSLMMAGDWLQGPYVYALYQHYGYSTGDIGKLFIAGFGSSMIFGTVVGSMADKYGRKNAALTYVVTYIRRASPSTGPTTVC